MNHHHRMTTRRVAFTLVELLVSVGILTLLVGLTLPAVMSAREASRRTQCGNSLRQYALAFHSYESAHGTLPAGGEQPSHQGGWRWQYDVRPFMEDHSVGFGRVRLDCPSKDAGVHRFRPSYAAADFDLEGSVAIGPKGHRLTSFTDGTSHTLLLAELWSDPSKFSLNQMTPTGYTSTALRSCRVPPIPDGPTGSPFGFGGPHGSGVACAFADGSVRVTAFDVSPSLWRSHGTRAGCD